MLQLLDIRKSYTTADFTQTALNDVSISFRDNEFVAILGPSGSGKTTMLNIVGGLDHYDSGNLIIDGISTEEYKDRDWDTYRNNRIGFVFQSYNLIPHQTVLSNVELALTLSGVSRSERREKAIAALEEVGLGEHVHKKPSQLSGGQMQRVAIARALINNPEILLADEPTGALDSKTSVQIMALLTEIAKDRLVIMVTHNPELADEYATRIVNLSDGVIVDDSDPFVPTEEDLHLSEKPVKKTSMSFFTALALSFNNLMTKKGRTLMTSFAGSIGIIGIAAILALANGVNNYIKSVEEETLSEYPLSIQSSGVDMTSMMVGMMGGSSTSDEGEERVSTGMIDETKTLTNMFSGIGSNDLASLKEYLEGDESSIDQYVNTIQYSYDVTPQVFNSDTSEEVRKVNPNGAFSSLGLGSDTSSNSLMSASMSTDIFYEMLDNPDVISSQYNVVAGDWPQSYDECVLVLNSNGGISDLTLYVMGLRDPLELDEMVKQLANNEEVEAPLDEKSFSYEEILDVNFKLINASDYYKYDKEYKVWKDMSDDTDYMKDIVNNGTELKIVGIVEPNPDAAAGSLYAGIGYTTALTQHLMDEAAQAEIIKKQIADPDVNVFTGRTFDEEAKDSGTDSFDMSTLITIDEEAIAGAFSMDTSALNIDLAGLMDPSSLASSQPVPEINLDDAASSLEIPDGSTEAAASQLSAMMNGLLSSYLSDYFANNEPPYDIDTITGGFSDYLNSAPVQAQITGALSGLVDADAIQAELQGSLQSYMEETMTSYMNSVMASMEKQMSSAMTSAMSQLSANMADAMSIDQEAFMDAFKINMSEKELTQLMMSFMNVEEKSYDNNLKKLGYASPDNPSGIDIYPIDFESKGSIITILDEYNERMEAAGEDEKVITFTDIVGTLMSSVTDIVNMVSYVLVAFVAISLVVSSIMIGVITYISVLERKKEIGILRSIGASKRDISRVFNAETLIVGFVAGFIGITLTILATIPANAIVYTEFDVANVAVLPWEAAGILITISMGLTFLAGLIPSSAASRKDPVEALRSE